MVALNSRDRFITERRRAEICAVTGQVMHLASLFHWLFVKQVVTPGIPLLNTGIRYPSERKAAFSSQLTE